MEVLGWCPASATSCSRSATTSSCAPSPSRVRTHAPLCQQGIYYVQRIPFLQLGMLIQCDMQVAGGAKAAVHPLSVAPPAPVPFAFGIDACGSASLRRGILLGNTVITWPDNKTVASTRRMLKRFGKPFHFQSKGPREETLHVFPSFKFGYFFLCVCVPADLPVFAKAFSIWNTVITRPDIEKRLLEYFDDGR